MHFCTTVPPCISMKEGHFLAAFGPTAENLREITTTIDFNVPKGYEELIACAINRSAAIVMPAQPFLDWLHQADPRVPSRDLRTTDIFAPQLQASPAALYD